MRRPAMQHGLIYLSFIVMSILNDQLYGSSPAEKYAPFFLGLHTEGSGELSYAMAGASPPRGGSAAWTVRVSLSGCFPVATTSSMR
jgi:hypothetical protein